MEQQWWLRAAWAAAERPQLRILTSYDTAEKEEHPCGRCRNSVWLTR